MSRRSARNVSSTKLKTAGSQDALPSEQTTDGPTRSDKRKSKFTSASKNQKRSKTKDFSPGFLFTNPKSCLTTSDLDHLLSEKTWQLLSTAEQRECLSLLPDVDKISQSDGECVLRHSFFQHNLFLQDSLRELQDNLAAGFLLPAEVRKGTEASRDRTNGRADAFKDSQFERFWGEKQKLMAGAIAGDTSNLKLTALVTSGLFEVGDVFKYSRTLAAPDGTRVTVEKECLLLDILAKSAKNVELAMTFRLPAGRERLLLPEREYVEVNQVVSLGTLETACLDTEGTVPRGSRANGNSWKVFRLKRKAMDIGSLFEIRQQAYKG